MSFQDNIINTLKRLISTPAKPTATQQPAQQLVGYSPVVPQTPISTTRTAPVNTVKNVQPQVAPQTAPVVPQVAPTKKYSAQEYSDAINGFGRMVYGGRVVSPLGSAQDIADTQDALSSQRLQRMGLFSYDPKYHLSPDQLSQIDNTAENFFQDRLGASVSAYANEQKNTASKNNLIGGGVSELNDKQFNAYNTLANTFDSLTKAQRGVVNAYNGIRDLGKLAKTGNYQAQIGMIFQFMKSLDPTSTVREGEQATAQNSAGVPDRIKNYYNDLVGNGRLQDSQIDGFIATAKELATAADKEISIYAAQQAKRAKLGGIPVEADAFYTSDLYDTTTDSNSQSGDIIRPEDIF